MIPIACACSKNRNRARADGTPGPVGTYRVMVNGRKAYETTSKSAAETMQGKFVKASANNDVVLLTPGDA